MLNNKASVGREIFSKSDAASRINCWVDGACSSFTMGLTLFRNICHSWKFCGVFGWRERTPLGQDGRKSNVPASIFWTDSLSLSSATLLALSSSLVKPCQSGLINHKIQTGSANFLRKEIEREANMNILFHISSMRRLLNQLSLRHRPRRIRHNPHRNLPIDLTLRLQRNPMSLNSPLTKLQSSR